MHNGHEAAENSTRDADGVRTDGKVEFYCEFPAAAGKCWATIFPLTPGNLAG